MRKIKYPSEVKAGDWIWWGKPWTLRPVLDAFFSSSTVTGQRLVAVKAKRFHLDRRGRRFVVYEIDPEALLPAPYQACEDADGSVRVCPVDEFERESAPAHYLEEGGWQIEVESPVCGTCKSPVHVSHDEEVSECDEDGTEYWRCGQCNAAWKENHVMDDWPFG